MCANAPPQNESGSPRARAGGHLALAREFHGFRFELGATLLQAFLAGARGLKRRQYLRV